MQAVPHTEHPRQTGGTAFLLGQPWASKPDDAFRPGRVWLGWTREALHVRAELDDDEIATLADGDNQRMWELGDVFEIFCMVEGRADYVELHVTPRNYRAHLALPRVGGMARPGDAARAFAEMLVWPVGFTSAVETRVGGWDVTATIPSSVFGLPFLEAGTGLRVAFARYDAAPGRAPVLSTTANHPVAAFHRPEDWARVRLTPMR